MVHELFDLGIIEHYTEHYHRAATCHLCNGSTGQTDLRHHKSSKGGNLFGEQCCTYFPMHMGPDGNLTKILQKMKKMRDEQVKNTPGSTEDWWEWLFVNWRIVLVKLATIAAVVLALLLILPRCIIPMLHHLHDKCSSWTVYHTASRQC